jgi:hypothetical protein
MGTIQKGDELIKAPLHSGNRTVAKILPFKKSGKVSARYAEVVFVGKVSGKV